MPDILGPALGGVFDRPVRTLVRGNSNTWFADCSSPLAEDGTPLTADYMNDVLAQLRTAFINANIDPDNADDMLWRAMQAAGIRYGADTGPVNTMVATFNSKVTATAVKNGMLLGIKVAVTNTAAMTLAADGLAAVPVVRRDGSPLLAGDLIAGQYALLAYMDGEYQVVNGGGSGSVATPPVFLPANKIIFDYTGADQNWTVPVGATSLLIYGWGAGSSPANTPEDHGSAGGYAEAVFAATGVFAPGSALKIMVGQAPAPTNRAPSGAVTSAPSSCYGFGGIVNDVGYVWSSPYGVRNAGGLSGVFTGAGTILATDTARARLIAGGGGGNYNYSNAAYDQRAGGPGGDPLTSGGAANMQGLAGSGPKGGGGGGWRGGILSPYYGNGGSSYAHPDATSSAFASANYAWFQTVPQIGNPNRGDKGEPGKNGRIVIFWSL